jgi:predicted RNase H-like HicB family nuclease
MTDLNFYLSLPYTKILRRDEDGAVIASIQELTGCVAHGDTEAEALSSLEEVQRLWLEESLAAGVQIPIPDREGPLPSGKWVQRVSRSLHQALTVMAKTEDVSLNQLVATILAEAVGRRRAIASARAVRAQLIAENTRNQLRYYMESWHRPFKWTMLGNAGPIDMSLLPFIVVSPHTTGKLVPMASPRDLEVVHGK